MSFESKGFLLLGKLIAWKAGAVSMQPTAILTPCTQSCQAHDQPASDCLGRPNPSLTGGRAAGART